MPCSQSCAESVLDYELRTAGLSAQMEREEKSVWTQGAPTGGGGAGQRAPLPLSSPASGSTRELAAATKVHPLST